MKFSGIICNKPVKNGALGEKASLIIYDPDSSEYVPCVAHGTAAEVALTMSIGDTVNVAGMTKKHIRGMHIFKELIVEELQLKR